MSSMLLRSPSQLVTHFDDETHPLFDGRALAVKRWRAKVKSHSVGEQDGVTLVMLHGWLDNAGSFDVLSPHLVNLPSVSACCAIDLAGHGRSDHRQDFLPYTLWDDAIDVCAWIKTQALDSVILVGHSRGAMVASIAASLLEEQISHLLLLDGAWPEPQSEAVLVEALQKALQQRTGIPKKATRFPSRKAALEARANSRFPVTTMAAECLAERGLIQQSSSYIWKADPKLHLVGGLKLSLTALQALSQNIRAKVHLWIAEKGVLTNTSARQMLCQVFPSIVLHDIEGNHHFHMDDAIVNKLTEDIGQVLSEIDCTSQ